MSPSRNPPSTAAIWSTSTLVVVPSMSMSGRKIAGAARVEVGETITVDKLMGP
jgi:hypothetical protein